MKTTKILASAFIFFALNANTVAADTSNKLINSNESNKTDIAYALKENGRNQHSRFMQDNPVSHFASRVSNQVTLKTIDAKGRNVAAIDSTKIAKLDEKIPFFATAGRNKQTDNVLISMQ